jgi:sugar-specific transcriptional regulator TrmB
MKSRAAQAATSAPPLAAALRGLGFTDYEARAYAALAAKQPATAYEIAKVAGLPRANVYSALRALEAKGAIQPVSEDPVRYVPVNPEQFFRGIQRSTAGLCEEVVREMKRAARDDGSAYVTVLRGEAEVRLRLREMIDGARHHVWLKGTVTLIAPHARELMTAASRGVTVRLIVFGQAVPGLKPHRRIQVIPHEGDGELHGPPSDAMLTATVDGSSMLIATFTETARASFARDFPVIYVIETLLLHEIYLAEIHAAFGPQLEARFGRQLASLRRKYRPRGRGRPVIEGREPAIR